MTSLTCHRLAATAILLLASIIALTQESGATQQDLDPWTIEHFQLAIVNERRAGDEFGQVDGLDDV